MVNMENILGKRIELERNRLGLSQTQLAKMLHLSSPASISQYERGERSPSDDIKIKMCELFNCTLDYLLGKSDVKTSLSSYFGVNAEGLTEEEIAQALLIYKDLKNKIGNFKKVG